MTLKQYGKISDRLFKQERVSLEWSHNEIQGFWWFSDNSGKPLATFKTRSELKGYIRCYLEIHYPGMLPPATED